ncbi:MAG TPA: MFS transporter [Mycobacteriales bacterium]|jgi:CP family cyanate transporter-like MFS transporter|nr:MFS transporter [Mycobacteriales bacterium]
MTTAPTVAPPVRERPGSAAVLLAAIVIVALNLRPAIAAVPPLLDAIRAELGLSGAAAGALTALPVVCMGLFAPAGAAVARRIGRERALAAALLLVAIGSLLRGVTGVLPLYVGSTLAGIGIAIGGTLLPGLVKAWFPDRAGAATGLYTTGLVGGAMAGAALSVPLHDALGDRWTWSLALWATPAVAALLVWWPVTRSAHDRPVPERGPLPWRSRTAWLVTLYMGGQSLLFYTELTWLSPMYTDAGWSPRDAGLLLGLFSLTQLFTAFGVPLLADRTGGDRRPWIAGCMTVNVAMLLCLGLVPLSSPWVWTGVLGLAAGGQLSLGLTLLADLAATPADAGRLSGMALGIGFLVASTGPVLAGALYDLGGGYRIPFLVLAVLGVGTMACGVMLGPHRRI